MASSDEEGEFLPHTITDYEFLDNDNLHISFACLPLYRGEGESIGSMKSRIFLTGFCDGGLQRIYKQVMAWKYELSYVQPEILVLCKGKHWIKLIKPKKVFAAAVRTILITIYYLHFVKCNPTTPGEAVWTHLSRAFSLYEFQPSELDITDHIVLIRDAAENDRDLEKWEYILGFLSEHPSKKKAHYKSDQGKKKQDFIVDEVANDLGDFNESDEEEDLFDTCCAFCDNGGKILYCEGRCMRSFRPTVASGEGFCKSLGLTEVQVAAVANFLCKNCQYQQHQCSICGKLGSSDVSSNAKVFPCTAGDCGRFYHPKCVAKALQSKNEAELEKNIARGDSFACPAHKCHECWKLEDRKFHELQFAVCRRCPKAYHHRKCLPRSIAFEGDMNIVPRAWDNLLPKRVLVYCLDHEIVPELGTPLRNHIVFPGEGSKKKHVQEHVLATNNAMEKITKQVEKMSSAYEIYGKVGSEAPKKASQDHIMIRPRGNIGSSPSKNFLKSYSGKCENQTNSCKKLSTGSSSKLLSHRPSSSSFEIDPGVERRVTALIEEANASFDMNEFMKNQKIPSLYSSSRNGLDENVTKGKVEVAVEAVKAAMRIIDNGGNIEDAQAVCSPEMLRQVFSWKVFFFFDRLVRDRKKLDVYLAPFLHDTRYSSYGRHFTKLEKLQEVVNRLHWYAQDGDMIVDFCCGANDFSCLMKEKLESLGKKCCFKNYDLFQTKNDFNFEKRGWFTVDVGELPTGSRLIMGLNPPFGFKAALANKFIDKALEFKPKILILIVPKETQRLDMKRARYDLIWEDEYVLAGKGP